MEEERVINQTDLSLLSTSEWGSRTRRELNTGSELRNNPYTGVISRGRSVIEEIPEWSKDFRVRVDETKIFRMESIQVSN